MMGSGEWEVKDGSKSWTHGKLETHESNSPITTKKGRKNITWSPTRITVEQTVNAIRTRRRRRSSSTEDAACVTG